MIYYTKEPWQIQAPPDLSKMDDLQVLAHSLRPSHHLPIVFATLADGRRVAIAKIYKVDGLSGTTDGNAALVRAAPEMAEFLLSGWQHVSHGGPTRGDLEALLKKIGLIEG